MEADPFRVQLLAMWPASSVTLENPPKLSKFSFLINTVGILINIFGTVSFHKIINADGVKKC